MCNLCVVLMKDWVDRQAKIEKDLLRAVGEQAQMVADDLLPQVRLAALEGEMSSTMKPNITFDFRDDETEVNTEGSVTFPSKHSSAASVVF